MSDKSRDMPPPERYNPSGFPSDGRHGDTGHGLRRPFTGPGQGAGKRVPGIRNRYRRADQPRTIQRPVRYE